MAAPVAAAASIPQQCNLSIVGTALHLACRHGVSVTVLRELLWQCADDAPRLLRHPKPCWPADLVYQQFRKRPQANTAKLLLLQRWNLLMAAAQGCPLTGEQDDRWIFVNHPHHALFTLHQILEFEHECTTHDHSLVPVYLDLYPDAVRCVDHTNSGRWPLHTACALYHGNNNRHRHHTAVQAILQAHPSAARVRDATGRLPLHVLLLDDTGTTKTSRDALFYLDYNSDNTVWQRLVEAFPPALETVCPVTRLLPYQLAATGTPDHQNDKVTTTTTTTIYTMLRACPQVVTVEFSQCKRIENFVEASVQ